MLQDKKTVMLPQKDEPIVNIVEVSGKKEQNGIVIAATLHGWLYLVNLVEN